MTGALDGLLVADFSRVLAGPYATQLLGDLGADVVKVERPGAGDDTRAWGPPFVDGHSTYYLAVNRNKRSVALDLTDEEQRGDALELARRADVLVENFRAGGAARFGLDGPTVQAANPGLIHCSISAFGTADPQGLPGYDFLAQAMGGLMSITGPREGEPTRVGVALVDVLTGMNAVIGILAALQDRERTGRGQHVQVDLLSSVLAATVNQVSGYLNVGVVPGRLGNRHPSVAPYETFSTADHPLAVAAGNDAQFARLCEALDRPWLADDPRFTTNAARVEHVAQLASVLGERFAQQHRDEWIRRLRAADVPCGPVNDLAQAVELAGTVGATGIVGLERGDGTDTLGLAAPLGLDRAPPTYRRAPPDLDEHGDELRAWLRGGPGPSPGSSG